MKHIKKLILPVLMLFVISGCENELERLPLDQLTIPTTFTTYSNVQTFAWGFYNIFGTYHFGRSALGEHSGDMMVDGRNNNGNDWIWQRIIVPATDNFYNSQYANIRRANLMMDNLETSEMNDAEKAHWRSVGLFFRSWSYFELLKRYGGVIWVENAIDDSDTDVLFGPKATRDEVAANILRDLTFAEANINPLGEGAGTNSIGVDAVRALMSRFGLFEGTWRKYHSLSDANTYLTASMQASEALMASSSGLMSSYDEVFNSNDLGGRPGIILYKEYLLNQFVHNRNQWTRSSESPFWDLTKKAADTYLLSDGTPVGADPDFVNREQDPYSEFRNRDRRMYYTITPPFQVEGNIGGNLRVWEHTGDPTHTEYIDLMAGISDELHKLLPENNWNGFIQPISPNFRDAGSQNLAFDPGYNVTASGYKQFKWYSNLHVSIAWSDQHDEPVLRMGEVLLNYAEAKFELGDFDQGVADASINLLRARAGMPNMNVAAIGADFDPDRDASVDPVLWEIRRERAVELMIEGFRFNDLRRWRKMDYATQEKLGRYIVAADYNNVIPVQNGASEGYISRIGIPPAWPDHYYLYPFPSNEIVLNPELEQNPQW